MDNVRNSWEANAVISTPSRLRLIIGTLRYLIGKVLTIALTIYLGVFITILLVNYPTGKTKEISPFQLRLESQIGYLINAAIYDGTIPSDADGAPDANAVETMDKRLRAEAGLDLPYLPRNLYWTVKALSFNWGELNTTYAEQLGLGAGAKFFSKNIVLEYLPNTLLLMGMAYLLVFLIGMPLSLRLARKHGNWLDRFFAFLSPISSVPGWVFGLLLISLFAVQLRWLPVGGMFDFHKPDDPIQYTLVLLQHMILPVTALVTSLLFQLIYAWRTFFIIYSEEDYVELARAKGLEDSILERQYILRPALPYIITSFTTSLIGFWQLAVALEVVFQWPGIGLLYIKSLPDYFGETMKLGDLMIVIQVVVVFAYLLGLLVLLLDIVYVIIDPRIRLIPPTSAIQTHARVKQNRRGWMSLFQKARMKEKAAGLSHPVTSPVMNRRFSWTKTLSNFKESLSETNSRAGLFIQELRRYPSAIFGLSVITLLLIGSLYAVIALPYEKFGREFDQKRFAGHIQTPRLAAPGWTNVFRTTPQFSRLALDENSPTARVVTRDLDNGWVEKTVTFTFEYDYQKTPSDVFLYLTPKYSAKIPFVSMVWTKPDGKTINLKALTASGDTNYDFDVGMPITKLLNQNSVWKDWFVTDGQYPTPAYELLFAQAGSNQLTLQPGKYSLEIKSLLFEPGDDVHSQLILLGQVYGMAGTDNFRRDLIVPLFWGMPFTLLVGFLGTLVTTLVAILLPAIGVWFGGSLDAFIQRLTDINMVLPGLAMVTLANAIFGIDIWILLAIVVVLNAFGSPIKTFRSALLQAKEAPYMEVARAYGASNFRIITRYLVPRILPVLIPQMITQIPSFIFLEATLGLFNIKSIYPTWGRIIYEGLASGAMYGSPFWVLEPISLLLVTGLAFAMLGSALERILNPRVLDQTSVIKKLETSNRRNTPRFQRTAIMMTALIIILMTGLYFDKIKFSARAIQAAPTNNINRTQPPASTPTHVPATVSATFSPLPTISATAPALLTPSATATLTIEPLLTPTKPIPEIYTLRTGEYPFCIARRFNIDISELLSLNKLTNNQTFFAGMTLQLPQTGHSFIGNRVLQTHPTSYTVSRSNQTLYTIACAFGDIDPLAIAQANNIPLNSHLFIGQQLNIP